MEMANELELLNRKYDCEFSIGRNDGRGAKRALSKAQLRLRNWRFHVTHGPN